MAQELKLGLEMEDATSGFRGIAVSKVTMWSGNVQFALQPRIPEGEPMPEKAPDAHFIDYAMLEVKGDGVSARCPPLPDTGFLLGDIAKDKVSGFKGTVTERLDFLNGCSYYTLVSEKLNAEGKPNTLYVPWQRLVPFKSALGRPAKSHAPDVQAEEKAAMGLNPETPRARRPPGGPSRPMSSVVERRNTSRRV